MDVRDAPAAVHRARAELAVSDDPVGDLLGTAVLWALSAYREGEPERAERRQWLRTLANEIGLNEQVAVARFDQRLTELVDMVSGSTGGHSMREDPQARTPRAALDAMLLDGSWAPTYSREKAPPSLRYVIYPAVVEGSLNFLHALPKSSKSNLMFHAVCSTLRGEDPATGVFIVGEARLRRALIVTEMSEPEAHSFLDLYDPRRELRESRKLLVAGPKFKRLLTSPSELGACLTAAVEADGIDLVCIDTFTAFSALGQGDSISEAAHVTPMINALQALPCTCWCVHHDRKGTDRSDAHVNMLGATALRAASSANLALKLLDKKTTLLRADLEARDATLLRHLAMCAEARAMGRPPPPEPPIAVRSWLLRLGHDHARDLVVFRKAESDMAASPVASEADMEEVHRVVLQAMLELTRAAALADAPRVFALKRITAEVRRAWGERAGSPPGRGHLKELLPGVPGVVAVKTGSYPDDGRRGGFGLSQFLPQPLGSGEDPGGAQ